MFYQIILQLIRKKTGFINTYDPYCYRLCKALRRMNERKTSTLIDLSTLMTNQQK